MRKEFALLVSLALIGCSPAVSSEMPSKLWNSVAASSAHTCGVNREGALYCWGAMEIRMPADDPSDVAEFDRPKRVGADDDWVFVTGGGSHNCALKKNGSLHCWGINSNGELGDGSQVFRAMPASVSGDVNWMTVVAGHSHTCGLNKAGDVFCWGANERGQVGAVTEEVQMCGVEDHYFECYLTPEQVGLETEWKTIVAGAGHTCAITTDGALYCWGGNQYGQVNGIRVERAGKDNEVYENHPSPTRIGVDMDWAQVAAGQDHTCGIRNNGRLFCWGSNELGQIGVVDAPQCEEDICPPIQVGAWTDWTYIAAGGYQTCGLRGTALYCWGRNRLGEIGDGTYGADDCYFFDGEDPNGLPESRNEPCNPLPTLVGKQHEWASVYLSRLDGAVGSTYGLTVSGALYGWGVGASGFGGNDDNDYSEYLTPTRVLDPEE